MADPQDSVDWNDIYQRAGQAWGVDPNLLPALRHGEGTTKDPNQSSEAGAAGPFQLMPELAKSYGVTDRYDPEQSAFAAARNLAENFPHYGNVDDTVRAYHGGPDPRNWGPKTEAYHDKVMAQYDALSKQPPKEAAPKEAASAATEETRPALSMDDVQTQIERLRDAGKSDNEIADLMAKSSAIGPLIAQGQQNGWKSEQIFQSFGLDKYQPQSRTEAAVHGFEQGVVQIPQDLLAKPIGAAVSALGTSLVGAPENARTVARQQLATLDRIDRGEILTPEDDPTRLSDATDAQRADMRKRYQADLDAPLPGDARLSNRIGKALQDFGEDIRTKSAAARVGNQAEETFPIAPERQQDFAVKFAKAAPGFAAYMGAAAVGGVPLLMGMAGTQAYGAAYDEARKKGLDENDAQMYGISSGLADGALSGVPLHKIMESVPAAYQGKVLKAIWEAGQAGLTNMGLGATMTVIDNVIARETGVDPKRSLTEGVPEQLLVNAGLGATPAGAIAAAKATKAGVKYLAGKEPNGQKATPDEAPQTRTEQAQPDAVPEQPGAPVEEMPEQPAEKGANKVEFDPEKASFLVRDAEGTVISAGHETAEAAQAEAERREARTAAAAVEGEGPKPVAAPPHAAATAEEAPPVAEPPAGRPLAPAGELQAPADVEQAARAIDPEAFAQRDELQRQLVIGRAAIQQHLDEARSDAQKAAPDYTQEIADLQQRSADLSTQLDEEKNRANQRRLRAQIRNADNRIAYLQQAPDDFINRVVAGRSLQIPMEVRQPVLDADAGLRDLGPRIAAATEQAAKELEAGQLHGPMAPPGLQEERSYVPATATTETIEPRLAEFRTFAQDAALPAGHAAARDFVVDRGRASGHEYLVAVDQATGEAAHAYTGDSATMVPFTPELAAQLNDPNQQIVIHHNHPNGSALSIGDLYSLLFPGLRAAVAHGHAGALSAAELTPEFRDHLGSLPAGEQASLMSGVLTATSDAAEKIIRPAVDSGAVSRDNAKKGFSAILNRALERAGLTHYLDNLDLDRHLPADLVKRAYDAAYEAVRPAADKAGLKPPKDAGDVRTYRPADAVRLQGGMGDVLGRREAAAAGAAGPVADRAGPTPPRQGTGLREEDPFPRDEAAGRPLTAPEETPHQEAVSGLIAAAGGEGTTPERARREIVQRGSPKLKNLNPVEKMTITPAALARLDTHFARLWNATKAKDLATTVNVNRLRDTIADSLVKLPAQSRDRVYAALELARLYDWRPQDNGAQVRVRNTSAWYARKSNVGDSFLLTPVETRALHDAIKLGDEGRRLYIESLARREGWKGPVDANAVAAAARTAGTGTPEGKKLSRLAAVMHMGEQDMRRPYFPAMRFGDYYIAVKPKEGVDTESLGGFPEVKWFETVERPAIDGLIGRVRANASDVRSVNERVAAIRAMRNADGTPRFAADRYDIETGDLAKKQDILRNLDMPAIEKLMMMMERQVKQAAMAKALRRADSPATNKTEARAEVNNDWERLHQSLSETLMEETYRELLAGYKRQAKLTPGYSGDFDRALGAHTYQLARSTADMVHRNDIESAYNALEQGHPEKSVKDYAKNWRAYLETPESEGARLTNTVAGYGFAYALGMNPASTLVFAAHTPMAAAPILSTGVGMKAASGALAKGLARAYARAGFDLRQGAHINTDRLGDTPQKKAYFKQLDSEGLLHSMGADDVSALNDRAAQPWSELRPTMRKAFDVATSNIRVVDQANRIGIADAAYELAKNPATLRKMAEPLMKNDALFQDMVREEAAQGRGLTPELMGRFLLQKAGFEWGKAARAPIQRGPLGTLLFTLHGFQTRYLSTAWNLMHNMGPEGKIAATWMLGSLAFGAGAYGLPFTQDLENLGDKLLARINGGKDPMIGAHVQQFLSGAFGKVGAEMILHGPLTELLGTDMTARIGFGDVISREMDPANVIGTIPSMLWSRMSAAASRLSSGQGLAAAGAELLPSGLRNPTMAAIQSQRGVVSQHGAMEVPPEKVTPRAVATQALGFRPLSQTRGFEQQDYTYRLQHQYDAVRRDTLREAALYAVQASHAEAAGDKATADRLRGQVQKLIAENPEAHITRQSLGSAIAQMTDPEMQRLMKMRPALRAPAMQSPYPEP